jgi:ubiquitin C-terminal hydrolase
LLTTIFCAYETGHYVSYCLINDKPQRCWEYFSDELHHPVSEEVVLAAQATMLFYEKVSA